MIILGKTLILSCVWVFSLDKTSNPKKNEIEKCYQYVWTMDSFNMITCEPNEGTAVKKLIMDQTKLTVNEYLLFQKSWRA